MERSEIVSAFTPADAVFSIFSSGIVKANMQAAKWDSALPSLMNWQENLISSLWSQPETTSISLSLTQRQYAKMVRGWVGLRPIAQIGEPAPFTCAGPGVNRGLKPDLYDDGGNILYDGGTQSLRRVPESEVFTTHHRYLDGPFTMARGTSCAAPLVTHKAVEVLRAFPNASANPIRAFLANSAHGPQPSIDKLGDVKIEELMSVCGCGMAGADRAVTSNENRVILFAEGEMPMDWFFVYEVPIPSEYAQAKGKRHIAVTLAFDPPTRHSRSAYFGVEMSFRLIRGKSIEWVRDHYRKREMKRGQGGEVTALNRSQLSIDSPASCLGTVSGPHICR